MIDHKETTRTRALLGLDIGGTKIEAIAVGQSLELLSRVTLTTDTSSPLSTVDSIADAIDRVLAQAGIETGDVLSAGVGVPGQVTEGVVRLAVNLKMVDYPLQDALSSKFPFLTVLENDVRAATLGAYQYIQARNPVSNLAYLSIGTGISAGLILNGELYRGSNGMAGEIGHIQAEPDGPRCNCGAIGCLEAVAAGPAIANQALEAVQSGEGTLLGSFEVLSAERVFEAAQRDDLVAQKIIQRSSKYLARAIHWLVMAYDVDRIVLGGGVTHAGDPFLNPILSELALLREQSELAAAMLPADKIVLLPKDYNAGAWGAIALAQRALRIAPSWGQQPEPGIQFNNGPVV